MANDLIEGCLRQDPKSQRGLYEKYRQSWFMTCLRYARNRMEADDIFQDGLMNVFKNLKQFDAKKAAFSTWSHRVMVNAALQYLRKWNQIDNLSLSESYVAEPIVEEDINDKMNAQELIKMIQKLPVGYRIVFNMYVLEGYKHKEIADILGITVSTSKTQLFKAKKILQKEVEFLFQNDYE
ncbi:MAG: sigma-70 family RNA polymerase sigma factor [Saprospiraceae bacterium]